MSGYVQSGAMSQGGPPSPTITGVTAGNTLICSFGSDSASTLTAPTDSAGGTWVIWVQTNGNGQTQAILHLFNAAAGTHTLTFSTGGAASQAVITEWSGITGVGGTPQGNNAASATTITSSTYTPSQNNEVVIAAFVQNGNNANDHNQCTTAAFQVLGTASDFGSNPCLGIEQNGAAGSSGEMNGQIITNGANQSATWTWSSGATSAATIAGYAYTPVAPPALDAGHLPYPGPGISPSALKQFFTPKRDTSAGSGALKGGLFTATSEFLGNLTAAGSVGGLFTSTSQFTGQLVGIGGLVGQFESASQFLGNLTQAQTVIGYIPKGGPGISPASMFQFSTLELDQQNFPILLTNGLFQSTSQFLAPMTGVGALAGIFSSTSQFTGKLTGVGGVGALSGLFVSSSSFFGKLTSGGPGALSGIFTSTSQFTGNLTGVITPITPGVCTNLWSADGNYLWTADGRRGWSADGYEPTPLSCAVTYFATVGVNVGTLTYAYSALVPVGYVITGYVPYINVAYAGQYIPLVISLGPPPPPTTYTVPNLIGLFYYDAQLAILQAGLMIDEPIWGFAPPAPAQTTWSAGQTNVSAGETGANAGGSLNANMSSPVLPQYVYNQTVAPGTTFTVPTIVRINVQGFPVVNQPGVIVPVP